MNKLQIVVNQKPGVISTNFEEIKAELSARMDIYKELEVTEENKPERKKDIATLRKMKKALDDRRIEVKKEYLKPCDDFEAKVKELTALIDDPIELIDNQVKVFEESQKLKKKQDIKNSYQELIGEMGEYIPLDRIYNSKWENVSVTMKTIREEMEDAISSTVMAVTTIKGMNSEAVPQALELYKKDLSLANAITYVNRYEQQKAEILAREEQKRKEEEGRKRRAEEERIRKLERKRVAEEERIREEARRKAIEEERQRVEAEKRKVEEEKARNSIQEIPADIPSVKDDIPEEPFFVEPEEPFAEESFSEEPFEVEGELPFVTVGEVKATFTVVGTFEEIEQVELYLNSIGLFFERKDA
ncbi:DUF1351 domain-containing protein [Anaerocolumna sp.]|uniref:DUF1351 domain-containing protein n=1 Tax=Anaerocolumna sp. TaxID=2041569 RepID=UPI0028AEE41E|nr:DUF1351 domain-containing protein [Anaerocolumna sp.]